MASLSGIPTEVLHHILDFASTPDLASVSLVNKSLHYVAEPFLYSTINLEWDANHLPPLVPLLRTLLERPELLAYIDSVSLYGSESVAESIPARLDMTKVPIDRYIAAIERTRVPFTHLWVDQLRADDNGGRMDAIAGLLIANLSKTTSLTIAHNFITRFRIISQVLQSKASGQLPKFDRLKRLIYCRDRPPSFPWFDDAFFPDAVKTFYLPTLTDLVVNIPNPENFQWPAGEPNIDHLTSLEVDWVYPRCFAKILARTRNLKSLFWNWEYSDDPGKPESILDYDKVVAAILPLKNNLETLRFRLHLRGRSLTWFRPGIAVLGSWNGLRDFREVAYLELPLIALAGTDIRPLPMERYIPDSVKTLCLSSALLTHDEGVMWVLEPEAAGLEIGVEESEVWNPGAYAIEVIRAMARNRLPYLPQLRRILFLSDHECIDKTEELNYQMGVFSLVPGIWFQIVREESWAMRHLPRCEPDSAY